MQFETFIQSVIERYIALTEEERDVVRNFSQNPVIKKLLGPEFDPIINMMKKPMQAPAQPAAMPEAAPVQQAPMYKGGLVQKPKRKK